MPTTTVRINTTTRQTLRELATQGGEPMQMVLEKAIETYRRQRFFDAMDAAYAALQNDPAAWQDELDERRLWEATLGDDLNADESGTDERMVTDHG